MIDQNRLAAYASGYGMNLTPVMLEQYDQYAQFLVDYNEKVNLTAITDPEGILVKHFLDAIVPVGRLGIPEGASLIDVGAGAGFPSVPIKIYRPDLKLTLMDAGNKRVTFLQQLIERLGLEGAKAVHFRAEEAGKKEEYRETFDFAVARAVAHLRELSEYCLPMVKVGGMFAAYKGFEIEQELEEAQKAINILGGKVAEVYKFELPLENARSVVAVKKISQTSTKYPRPSAKMAKSPL